MVLWDQQTQQLQSDGREQPPAVLGSVFSCFLCVYIQVGTGVCVCSACFTLNSCLSVWFCLTWTLEGLLGAGERLEVFSDCGRGLSVARCWVSTKCLEFRVLLSIFKISLNHQEGGCDLRVDDCLKPCGRTVFKQVRVVRWKRGSSSPAVFSGACGRSQLLHCSITVCFITRKFRKTA